jgi:predicted AlkP superfamily pyrophosphatase or phosphodiesterase
MSQRRFALLACATLVCLALGACAGTHAVPAAAPISPLRASGGVNRPEHLDKPYVVLISLDGFRPAYLQRDDVPNLRRLLQRGTRATALRPVFPSWTFPNHYSLVTGLFVDRHGIVANSFFDPVRRQTYSLSNRDAVGDGTWYRGEPIWVTAETQGMVASCFLWPGSEAAIKGIRPTEWRPYDSGVTMEARVSTIVRWLQQPAERRPHLLTLYFAEVDSASHNASLDAPAVGAAIRAVDGALGALIDGIDTLPIRDRIYLIVTSDHGMVETSAKQTIRLDSLVDMSEIAQAFGGGVANLHLHDASRATRVRDALNAGLLHGRAYLRDEVPARHRYRGDPRMGHIVVVMDEAWSLVPPPRPGSTPRERERWGAHGWDPAFASMRAIFIAAGPRVPAGGTIPEVRNVDVYPLMTGLLGLRAPAGIDGRLPESMRGWIAGP